MQPTLVVLLQNGSVIVSPGFCTDLLDQFYTTSSKRLVARWCCLRYLLTRAPTVQPESEKVAAGPTCSVVTLWKSPQSVSVLLLEWLQCCSHVTALMWVMESLLNSTQQGQTHCGLHTHPKTAHRPLCWAAAPSAGSIRTTTSPWVKSNPMPYGFWFVHMNASILIIIVSITVTASN